MKRTHIYIAVALILIILSSLIFYWYINGSTNTNLGTIGFSDTYATVSAIYQRKTFYANGSCWLFYCNGTHFLYTNSSNGLDWQTPTTIKPLSSASALSIWYNGKVHYALAPGTPGDPVVYREGEIVGSSVVWDNQKIAIQGVTPYEYYNGYCIVDSEGHPWVSCLSSDGTYYNARVARANSSDGDLWSQPMELLNPSIYPPRTCILPLPEAKIYAICISEVKIEGKLWNGNAWQQTEAISDKVPASDFGYSAVSLNGEIHLAYLQNETNNILHCRRLTNGTWEETEIANAQDRTSFPVLSIDAPNGTLYCMWTKGDTIQLRKRENEQWETKALEKLALTSVKALSCFYSVTNRKLGIAILEWMSQDQLYRLRYYMIRDL